MVIKKAAVLLISINLSILWAESSITWATTDDWPPVFYENPSKPLGYGGLWPQIIYELFSVRMGLEVEVVQLPWSRAQSQVRDGQLDFMVTLPTEEREGYAVICDESIMDFTMQIYTYRDHPKLEEIRKMETVADLIRLDLVTVSSLGNGWHKENIESMGVKTLYVKQEKSLPRFLALKRADIMIDSPLTMNQEIRRLGLEHQIVLTDVVLDRTSFHLMISRDSDKRELIEEVDRILSEMKADGTMSSIYDKYMALE